MRDELHLIELADRYLRGELNEADRKAFEARLGTNAELRELVEDQRVLQQGIERLALRPAVDLAYRSYRFGKWMPGMGGVVIVAIVSVGGWMAAQRGTEHEASARIATDTSAIERTITLSDTTQVVSAPTLCADTTWDTVVVSRTVAVEQILTDTAIPTNEPEVRTAQRVGDVRYAIIDPAPPKIIEGLTEALDSQPMFVGGNEALRSYLLKNLRYPPQAEAKGVQGRVTISFVIRSDGGIEKAEVVSGIGYGCDEEALLVVLAMPKWIPAVLDGRPVNFRYTLPIVFRSSAAAIEAPRIE